MSKRALHALYRRSADSPAFNPVQMARWLRGLAVRRVDFFQREGESVPGEAAWALLSGCLDLRDMSALLENTMIYDAPLHMGALCKAH